MYLLHDSDATPGARDKLGLKKQITSGYVNLNKVRRASRVETTISYPKGQMPLNARLSIISNTSSYGYRHRYIHLKETSF